MFFEVQAASTCPKNWPWGCLEPTWGNLKPTWGQLEATWGQLEATWGQHRAILRCLGANLRPTWAYLTWHGGNIDPHRPSMSQLEATGRPKKVEDKSAGRYSRQNAAYTPPPDPLPRLTPFKQESLQRSGSRGSASRHLPASDPARWRAPPLPDPLPFLLRKETKWNSIETSSTCKALPVIRQGVIPVWARKGKRVRPWVKMQLLEVKRVWKLTNTKLNSHITYISSHSICSITYHIEGNFY